MIPDERLIQILQRKDHAEAQLWCDTYNYSEGWAIIDGALVIYNLEDPPSWFPGEDTTDENGLTKEFVQAHRDQLDEDILKHSDEFWGEHKEAISTIPKATHYG